MKQTNKLIRKKSYAEVQQEDEKKRNNAKTLMTKLPSLIESVLIPESQLTDTVIIILKDGNHAVK